MRDEDIRSRILSMSGGVFWPAVRSLKFTPGKTYIPCTGKVMDAQDLRFLLDASLDLWLTTGRLCC